MMLDEKALEAAARAFWAHPGSGAAPLKALAEAITAYLTAAAAEPRGWRLAPEEPPPEMMEVYARHQCAELGLDPDEQVGPDWPRWYSMCQGWDRLYRAMLAAAPQPPATGDSGSAVKGDGATNG